MSFDLGALTGSVVVGLPGVQACLVVSRDGLPLAAYPSGAEGRVNEAWLRLAELGNVRRGFVVVDGEVWAVSCDGAYGAFAVGSESVRPAALLDRLDRLVARLSQEPAELPSAATSTVDVARSMATSDGATPADQREPEVTSRAGDDRSPTAESATETDAVPSAPTLVVAPALQDEEEEEDDAEVAVAPAATGEMGTVADAIALAREFAGLIPEDEAG